MTLTEYQKECRRTFPEMGPIAVDLAHMVLGLSSEYNEYIDAVESRNSINVSEECADMMWYLANYCTLRGYDLQEIFDKKPSYYYTFNYNLSKLQDLVKKYLVYNKEIDTEKEKEILRFLSFDIYIFFKQTTISIEQSLQNNIDKLKVRFPEKFTKEAANNRDLEAELKELSK